MSHDPYELPKTKNVKSALQSLQTLKEKNPGMYEMRLRIASILYKTDFQDNEDFFVAAMMHSNFDLNSVRQIMGNGVLNEIVDIRKIMGCPSGLYSILGVKPRAYLIAQQMARVEMVLDGYADKKTGKDITLTDLRDMTEALTTYMQQIDLPECTKLQQRYREVLEYSNRLQIRDQAGPSHFADFGNITPQNFNSFGKKPF